ncbi:MAG: hypothetical protein PHN49_02030 [Candidatus Omnitrophica bacterium]|nr:hypothetical protein [Candidatus Omnitrophota bacterium]MDD5670397.1 hypothetical protein [Candidatus Omnitrophota bacterium]
MDEKDFAIVRCGLRAFWIPFGSGLFVFSAVYFWMTPLKNLPDSGREFFAVISLMALPWGAYTFFSSLLIGLTYYSTRAIKPPVRWIAVSADAWILAALAVALLLKEQQNCDSVCLGLNEKIFGTVPCFAALFAGLGFIGLVQLWIYARDYEQKQA